MTVIYSRNKTALEDIKTQRQFEHHVPEGAHKKGGRKQKESHSEKQRLVKIEKFWT